VNIIFPEEREQQKLNEVFDEVLGERKVSIFIRNFILREEDEKKQSHVTCDLMLRDKAIKIKGTGSGAVNALYGAIIEKLSKQYKSLNSVRLEDFSLRVKFKKSRNWNQTDAPVEIKIALRSDKNRSNLYFSAEAHSLMVAAISAIRKAIVFLINSELSVIQLKKDIQSARRRNRHDLVSIYTLQLSEILHIADYEHLFKNS